MIEKIKGPLDLKVGNYKGTEFDIIPAETFAMVCRKINELIDAVNELTSCVGQLGVEFTNEETKEPVDPYKKQRKWEGKLCWFWDDDKEAKSCGILTEIVPENHDYKGQICPCLDDSGDGYMHCKPVKPDDDIIYKGDDNESKQ